MPWHGDGEEASAKEQFKSSTPSLRILPSFLLTMGTGERVGTSTIQVETREILRRMLPALCTLSLSRTLICQRYVFLLFSPLPRIFPFQLGLVLVVDVVDGVINRSFMKSITNGGKMGIDCGSGRPPSLFAPPAVFFFPFYTSCLLSFST